MEKPFGPSDHLTHLLQQICTRWHHLLLNLIVHTYPNCDYLPHIPQLNGHFRNVRLATRYFLDRKRPAATRPSCWSSVPSWHCKTECKHPVVMSVFTNWQYCYQSDRCFFKIIISACWQKKSTIKVHTSCSKISLFVCTFCIHCVFPNYDKSLWYKNRTSKDNTLIEYHFKTWGKYLISLRKHY